MIWLRVDLCTEKSCGRAESSSTALYCHRHSYPWSELLTQQGGSAACSCFTEVWVASVERIKPIIERSPCDRMTVISSDNSSCLQKNRRVEGLSACEGGVAARCALHTRAPNTCSCEMVLDPVEVFVSKFQLLLILSVALATPFHSRHTSLHCPTWEMAIHIFATAQVALPSISTYWST